MDFVIENNILKGAAKQVDVDRKLGQLIFDALNASPDHVSQIDADTGGQTTCAEMKERSVRCALWMKKLGIGADDIVVVVTHNHLDTYIPVFATFFVDAIFSAWNHGISLYTARRYMKQFTPKLIFTCAKAVDVLAEAAKLENLSVKLVVFGKHSGAQPLSEIMKGQTKEEVDKFEVINEKSPEDVTAVMLSSGSTGFPKGVMLKTRTLLAFVAKRDNPPNVTLKFLWYSTLDWVSGIAFSLSTLLGRHTRIISNDVDVENFFKVAEKYKVNFAFIPPILVTHVAKSDSVKNYDLQSLKSFMVGGSKHTKQILEGLHEKIPTAFIVHGYGSTETAAMSFASPDSKHIESTGFVVPNCRLKFADLASGKALGPNQNGEVRAKTPNIMIGYYNDPEATKQAFDEQGWYRTGDIGYYDETGEIFIVDRIKDTIKYRNAQIAPVEIEELLLSHPEIQEAAVVSVPHEVDGDWPVAFVKKRPGSKVCKDDLVKLTSILEDYKQLRGGIHFIDNMPQTGSGKIAKNELRQLAQNLMNGS